MVLTLIDREHERQKCAPRFYELTHPFAPRRAPLRWERAEEGVVKDHVEGCRLEFVCESVAEYHVHVFRIGVDVTCSLAR